MLLYFVLLILFFFTFAIQNMDFHHTPLNDHKDTHYIYVP